METPKTRILIVEDNPDDQDILLWQLQKAGLHQYVRIISDGKVAIDYIRQTEAHCEDLLAVFLDLKLPSTSGLKVLEEIRKCGAAQTLPVIVMTSSNSLTDLEKCNQLGVASYVQKPVTFEIFAKIVADKFHVPRTQLGSGSLASR